jgi:hypothetical protein
MEQNLINHSKSARVGTQIRVVDRLCRTVLLVDTHANCYHGALMSGDVRESDVGPRYYFQVSPAPAPLHEILNRAALQQTALRA